MAGEDDMTFFESEEEGWMMGDFDIDLDVDLGRPIDLEVDESVRNHYESRFQDANGSSGNVDPRKGTSVSGPSASVSAQPDGPVSVSGNNNDDDKEVRFQPLLNMRLSGSGNDRGQPLNGLIGNGDRKNGNGGKPTRSSTTPSVQASGSDNSRPSAGGFSFPPGAVRAMSSRVLGCEVDAMVIYCAR